MKYQKESGINTQTTVSSTSQFATENSYSAQSRQFNRHTSIISDLQDNKVSVNYGSYVKNSLLKSQMPKQKKQQQQRQKSFDFDIKKKRLVQSLSKVISRRKSYCFQIIKQFFIFPDQTASSNWSVSTYDKLIFHDENIHSMVKILQTKTIQNKIWGFLNLKTLPKIKATKIFTQTISQIVSRNRRVLKKQSFQFLRQYSEGIQLRILKQKKTSQVNIVQKQIKTDQCKSQRNSRINFSSSIFSQQVRPIQRIRVQSPVKIYRYQKSTTGEYEKTRSEYEKTRSENTGITINMTPRVIYPEQTYKLEQTRHEKINKYNIINYYQRPRTIIGNYHHQHEYTRQSNQQAHYQCCNCCQNQLQECCAVNKNHCEVNQRPKVQTSMVGKHQKGCSRLNQTCFTQCQENQMSNYHLSQLQSRIQYLKFLQKVVKQQEQEQNRQKLPAR